MKYQPKSHGIFVPNDKIIGSTPKKEEAPKTRDYSLEIEYNKNINLHPDSVKNLLVRDNHVIVKLFKFDKESTTKAGILVVDSDQKMTEGGKLRYELKSPIYQKRGVIVSKGLLQSPSNDSLFDKLNNGTIVHLSTDKLTEFHLDKTIEVDENHGYFLVHVGLIDCIELV